MKVVILHDRVTDDARPDELDVLAQIEAVSAALTTLGHVPVPVPFSLDLVRVTEDLRRRQPDVVFNLVESVEGSGRLIYLAPALLDWMGLRYTGVPTEGIFLTSNKILAKRILRADGVATPDWHDRDGSGSAKTLRGSFVIKSVWEDASIGLEDDAVIDSDGRDSLREALLSRSDAVGGQAFAESYVDGREFNLSLLTDNGRPQVLPAAEIRFVGYAEDKPKVVGYRAKWDVDSFEYRNTPNRFEFADEDRPILDELANIALRCWDTFGLGGYARVDFRVDKSKRPWVLEINPNPCLSPDAGFIAAARRAGMEMPAVVSRLLEDALRRS
jgi:D-alanine-D-alanine ligase